MELRELLKRGGISTDSYSRETKIRIPQEKGIRVFGCTYLQMFLQEKCAQKPFPIPLGLYPGL